MADPQLDDSAALGQALDLAGNNQAKLTVLSVVEASERQKAALKTDSGRLLESMVEFREEELRSLTREHANPLAGIDVKVRVGIEFLEVIREVLEHHRDLVIKTTSANRDFARRFASTDMKLLRKCPCPVWLIKSFEESGFRQILAALDYDPESTQVDELNGQILEMATSLALSNFAELHVVHAWQLPFEDFLRSPRTGISPGDVDDMTQEERQKRERWLEGLVRKHCETQGEGAVDYLKPELHLSKGRASQLVPALAQQLGAELVVMGTVGRTGIPGLVIGNTAEDILQQLHCSVLTVKHAEFVTPVQLES